METESHKVVYLLKWRADILCSKRKSQRPKEEKKKCRRHGDAIKRIISGKDGRFLRQVKQLIQESTGITQEVKSIMKSDIDGFMTRASVSRERSRSSSPKPSRFQKLMSESRSNLDDDDDDVPLGNMARAIKSNYRSKSQSRDDEDDDVPLGDIARAIKLNYRSKSPSKKSQSKDEDDDDAPLLSNMASIKLDSNSRASKSPSQSSKAAVSEKSSESPERSLSRSGDDVSKYRMIDKALGKKPTVTERSISKTDPSFVDTMKKWNAKSNELFKQVVTSDRKRVLVDLFCGCGGFSAGAMMAGVIPVLGVDSQKNKLKAYKANFKSAEPFRFFMGPMEDKDGEGVQELSVVDAEDKEMAELMEKSVEDRDEILLDKILEKIPDGRPLHLHGSPPCTTASSASNDKIDKIIEGCHKCTKDLLCDRHDSSGRSVEWFLKFVEKVRNAVGAQNFTWSIEEAGLDLNSKVEGKTRAKQLLKRSRENEALGYPQYVVLDAASCGVPSRRERLVGGVGFDLMNMLHTLGSQTDFCNKSNFLDVLKMCGIDSMPKDTNGIYANKQATAVKSTAGVGGELKGKEVEYHMTDMSRRYYAKNEDGKRLWPFTEDIKTMLERRGYMAKDYKESKDNDKQLLSDYEKCSQHNQAKPIMKCNSDQCESLKCSTKNNKGFTCEIVKFQGKPAVLPVKVRKEEDDWSKPYSASQKMEAVSSRVAAFDQILRSATIMLFPRWVRVFQTPIVIDGSLNTKIWTGDYKINKKGKRTKKMKNETVETEYWVNCRLMRYLNAREGKAMLGFPNDFVASCEEDKEGDCVREDEEKENSEVARRCIGDSVSPAVSFCMFATSKMGDLQRTFKQPSGSRSLSLARSDGEGTVATVANLHNVFDIAEKLGGRRNMQDVALMLNRTFTHWNDLDESISKRITADWFRSQLQENSDFAVYITTRETSFKGSVSSNSSNLYRNALKNELNRVTRGKTDKMEEILEQTKRVIKGLPPSVEWSRAKDNRLLRTAYRRFMDFVQRFVTKQFFPVSDSAAGRRLQEQGVLTDGRVDERKLRRRLAELHPDRNQDDEEFKNLQNDVEIVQLASKK